MMQQKPFTRLRQLFNIDEQFGFGFFAETFDVSHQPLLAGGFQSVDALDSELVMQRGNFFQAQSRHPAEFHGAGWQLLAQLLQQVTLTGLVNFFDDGSERCTDAGDRR